ncbi:A kinase (PRKA) anchor protein 1b [Carcharodon carcharias]|uniref:A kinase (PRKA) anchor protein 1b n=1 Tax=Carcharodon carcharias TaxID=13397 RepID=UPI001B7F09C0|nr:A kinase (PRKA) anchor protein 1b [Carcharodon carcharias]
MALRFRTIFPYTLPGVLALIGWWWYITRKKRGRESSHSKAKLPAAPESITKAGGEHHVAADNHQDFSTVAELTQARKKNQGESIVKPLELVPAVQVEALEQSDTTASSLCLLKDGLEANVEKDARQVLLDPSPRSQEVLFMSNVQGPLQTSPKVEKESYLHQMMDKISIDPMDTRQPSVCTLVKSPTPFPVPSSSVSLEAEGEKDNVLPNLSSAASTECEQPVPDRHSMERPEPEGENAGNLSEPPCFKSTLSNVSISPFLIPAGLCQESEQESQSLKEASFTKNGLPADSTGKAVDLDAIEEAAAGLISEVITAAKQELYSSQFDPCAVGVCGAGETGGKLVNPTVDMPVLSQTEDSQGSEQVVEVRQASEKNHSLSETDVTPKVVLPKEGAVGDFTKLDCEHERHQFAAELPASVVSRKPLEEANLIAEDSGCHSEDGAGGEDLSGLSVTLHSLVNHEDALNNCMVTRVNSEPSCEEKLTEPKMAPREPGAKGSVPRDCIIAAHRDKSQTFTEELQPATNEPSEELNATAEDSGCSVCHSDGSGGEDLLHTTVAHTLENQKTDALHNSLTGRSSLEQDPKHRRRPLGQQGTKLTYANGGRAEEGADGNAQMLLEMEFDHSGGSDVNSMDSNDSGCTAGGAEGQSKDGAGLDTTPDKTELTIWEIQVPKHLVGRLIGKQGRYVSFLKQTSGAKIYISTLPYTQDFQICHIEGNQHQVDKALNLIGKKFKELDLGNLYVPPPPLTLPSLPITSWLMLPDGVTVDVLVVNIVNAGHMFVQQHTHPTCHVLRNMDQQMFLLYSQPGIPTLTPPLEVGIICAAPAVDGAWWRAQVVAYFEETNEVEIRYVDYGGYERVKIEALRQIRSDFVSLPFQGTEVLLDNIMPLPGEDHFSEEANTAMDEMTRGAALLAQVTGYDNTGVPLINLWSIVGDEVLFLNRILVEKGHAQWIENY